MVQTAGRGRPWWVFLLPLLVFSLFSAEAAVARICKWVDSSGTLWFVSCKGPKAKRGRILRAPRGKEVPPQIDEVIERVAREESVDPDLVRAVVAVESDFDPMAVSSSGAMGLMQLMPQTAAIYGVSNPWDPYENVKAGTRYLKHLLGRYNNDLKLALAAYNAGPTTVSNYGGVPPYAATKRYIAKVLQRYPTRKVKGHSTKEASQQPVSAKKRRRGVRRVVLSDGSVLYTNLPQ